MAQVGDQVAQHFIRAGRITAGQVLRTGQRVVEEMRFHLRMQQAQLGDGEFFLSDGLLRGSLFVAAVLGHAAGDGAGDGLGIFQVGAVVHLEPVAPCTAFRLAHQAHAADAVARRHRGQDLVALDVDPVQRIEPTRCLVAVRVEAGDLGPNLQAVARAFYFFRTWQFADGRVHQVERFARFQWHFHLPCMPVGQRAAINPACNQADAADMGNRASNHEAQGDHEQQEEQSFRPAAIEDLAPHHQEHQVRDGPGSGDTEDEEEAGFHGMTRLLECDGDYRPPRPAASRLRRNGNKSDETRSSSLSSPP